MYRKIATKNQKKEEKTIIKQVNALLLFGFWTRVDVVVSTSIMNDK